VHARLDRLRAIAEIFTRNSSTRYQPVEEPAEEPAEEAPAQDRS